MPDFPDEVVQRAAEVMFRQYESQYSAGHLTWRDFADDARAILGAAAPALGEHAARKILAHMEAHGPKSPPGEFLAASRWRRHFSIAARVASRAFLAEEDMKRLAAEALVRGDYVACDLPEEQP